MDVVTLSAWAIGIIVIIGVALAIRSARKPADPEESLKELLGSRGMAMREHNRASSEAKHNAMILEAVTKSAAKCREEGDFQEAKKLEAQARTIRARSEAAEELENPNQPSLSATLSAELKPYLTQLCRLHATTKGFPFQETSAIGQDIFNKYGHKSMIAVHDALRSVLGTPAARDLERQWDGIGEWLG